MSKGLDVRFVVLLVALCGLANGVPKIDPLVSTKLGLIRGLRHDRGYAVFLGVPYGVVDRRNPFGPSSPHPGFEDTFEAYESNMCPQVVNGVAVGTLDCLTMNIYVPSTANSRNRLPVMVWIYGGNFVAGSGDRYDPYSLLKNDVIVITINYRLGVYGFMCLDHPAVPGNQGLKDQVLALRWINENIEAFGGDSNRITAFGQSGGGQFVNLHMLSPQEKLFNRAIIQSGPALSPWIIKDPDDTMPLVLAQELSFNTTNLEDALVYLATVPPHLLAQVALDTQYTNSQQPKTKACFEREYDGVENFITERPRNIVSNKANTIPVIIGTNSEELAFRFGSDKLYTAETFATLDIGAFLDFDFDFGKDLAEAVNYVRQFYFGDEPITEDLKFDVMAFAADFLFHHPTQRMTQQLMKYGAKTIYRYVFSYMGNRNLVTLAMNLTTTGAAHGDELGYLFDYELGDISFEDQIMINRMTTLWTNFAKYGDPTPQTTALLPVKWEPITKTTQPYLDLNLYLSLESRPFKERMVFWDLFYKLYEKYLK